MAGVLGGFSALAAVIAVGYLVGRVGLLGGAASAVLSRLAFYVATPALLFLTLADADIDEVLSSALLATAGGAVVTALLYAVLVRLAGRRSCSEITVGALAASYVNAGNLGIPIAVYVLGDARYVAPVLLFQVLVMAPVGVGLLASSRRHPARADSRWRLMSRPLRTPVVVGSALGLAVAVSGLQLPGAVLDPVELIAALAVPLALMSYGLSLHGAPRPGSGDVAGQVWLAVALKVVGMPLVAYLLGRYAADLDGRALMAVTITSALPTAQNVFVYASTYERSTVLARDAVLLSTVLSVPVLLVVAVLLS